MPGGKIEKVALIPLDGGKKLEFMFNPPDLSFTRKSNYTWSTGARDESGEPKTSFTSPSPCMLTLSQIPFDTYEEGDNVLDKYINDFKKTVMFKEKGKEAKQRPPIYKLKWGKQIYFSACVITSLTYHLTMFLRDGTPVRAMLSLTIQEVDDPKPRPNPPAKPTRGTGGRTK
jgi:Contractile injection system tube protein